MGRVISLDNGRIFFSDVSLDSKVHHTVCSHLALSCTSVMLAPTEMSIEKIMQFPVFNSTTHKTVTSCMPKQGQPCKIPFEILHGSTIIAITTSSWPLRERGGGLFDLWGPFGMTRKLEETILHQVTRARVMNHTVHTMIHIDMYSADNT